MLCIGGYAGGGVVIVGVMPGCWRGSIFVVYPIVTCNDINGGVVWVGLL